MLEIDGDDSSTTTADVTELQLLIEGAAAVEVDINISYERSVERRRCCGGKRRASPALKWLDGAASSS